MSYNGYGEAGYGDMGAADYLNGAYGAYAGDPVLSATTRKSNKAATKELQGLLIQRGFGQYLGQWQDDGDFHTATTNALKAFQASVELPPTGFSDQETWNRLRAVRDVEPGAEKPSYRTGKAKNWAQSLLEGLGVGAGLPSFQPSAQAGTTALTTPGQQAAVAPPEKPSVWPWVLGIGGISVAIVLSVYLARDKGKGKGEGDN